MTDPAINALMASARCFKCLPPPTQFEVQTYIIAYIAGEGTDPKTLSALSKAFQELNTQTLLEIKAYLLATIAGYSTDPNSLAERARCYRCIPDGMMGDIQTYLLSNDPNGPGITDPNQLADAAKAFMHWPINTLLEIQVYLLARIAGVTTDPKALALLAKCLRCLPFPVLTNVINSVTNDLESDGGLIPGGGGCTIGEAPVITAETRTDGVIVSVDVSGCACADAFDWVVYGTNNADGSGGIELMTWADTGATGDTVTETIPIPVPIAFDYYYITMRCGGDESDPSEVIDADSNCETATAVIDVTGAGDPDANGLYFFNQAYYDLSGLITYDNPDSGWIIQFTAGTGGVEALMVDAALSEKYQLPLGECFPCGAWEQWSGAHPGDLPAPSAEWSDINAEAVSWYDRVVKNGGAQPSNNSVEAAAVFMDALTTASIRTKIKALNFIAPDSLIAATTPLIKDYGNDPWTNTGFVLADLTIDGMKADGLTKFLNTGVNPNTVWSGSTTTAGLSLYHVGPIGLTGLDIGASNATGGTALTLYAEFGGTTYFDCWANSGGGRVSYANLNFRGFISGNRLNANDIKLYDANSGSAFAQRASGVNTLGSVPNVGPCAAFGYNNNGVLGSNTSRRISFFAIHDGLTSAQAEDLYDAVQALRTAIGGGYI